MINNTFTLINYFDVWGNEEDGYEVNDACVEAEDLVITDEATDEDIVDYLFQNGYLTTNDFNLFEVDDSGDFIEIYEKAGLKPLYSLRRNVA